MSARDAFDQLGGEIVDVGGVLLDSEQLCIPRETVAAKFTEAWAAPARLQVLLLR